MITITALVTILTIYGLFAIIGTFEAHNKDDVIDLFASIAIAFACTDIINLFHTIDSEYILYVLVLLNFYWVIKFFRNNSKKGCNVGSI